MSIINYAVEIITEQTSFSNSAYGLVNGTFRWITGRPGYDGNDNPYPLWEDTTDNTYKWFESFLLKEGMSEPTRSIDIKETGDYGSTSSFTFTIRNDILLWKYVRDNGIYFVNRTVNLYIIIDDTFYAIWSGVCSNNPMESTQYEFSCIDQFKKVHKMLPPIIINKTLFPDSSEDMQGKPLPVVIGNVTYAKLFSIKNEVYNLDLTINTDGFPMKTCGAGLYKVLGKDNPELTLYTPGKVFAANELTDRFIYVAAGGQDPDTNQLIRIKSNAATTLDDTVVVMEAPFDFVTEQLFSDLFAYNRYHYTYFPEYKGSDYTTRNVSAGSVTFEHVDFSNNGLGANQIKFLVGTRNAAGGVITIVVNMKIVGICIVDNTGPFAAWKTGHMTCQFDNDATVTFLFQSGLVYANTEFAYWTARRNVSDQNTYWFSIVDMANNFIMSNSDISSLKTDDTNTPYLWTMNTTTQTLEYVPFLIDTTDISGATGITGHPELTMFNNVTDKEGSVRYLMPIPPEHWNIKCPYFSSYIADPITGDHAYGYSDTVDKQRSRNTLGDKNKQTYITWKLGNHGRKWNTYDLLIDLTIPPEAAATELEDVFVGLDFNVAIDAFEDIRMSISIDKLDSYNNVVMMKDPDEPFTSAYPNQINLPVDPKELQDDNFLCYMLPDEYYKDVDQVSFGSRFWSYVALDDITNPGDAGVVVFKNTMKLDSALINSIRDGSSTNKIRLTLNITTITDTTNPFPDFTGTINIVQAAFVGMRSVSTNNDFYISLEGETIHGNETSNVYRTFQLMLEKYDGIPTGMVDYTNLPTTRSDWNCGRQLTEQKSSFDYIKELATHSFVGVFPSRKGIRTLKSWRDDETVVSTFEPTNIIRDSITSFEKSQVSELYNQFRLEYDWNPAFNNFGAAISVDKIDQEYEVDYFGVTGPAGFPGATGMYGSPPGLNTWKTYISGLNPNSYPDAVRIWEVANESWRRAQAIQPLPPALSKLYWYYNSNVFDRSQDNNGANTKDSAFRYLTNLSEWTTRQKDLIKFSIPITATNVIRELLDYVRLSDTIFTDSEYRLGWITGVKFNIKRDRIDLEVTLEPEDQIIDNLIIERGQLLNVDTIDETGSQTDQIQDGQGRI